MKALCSYCEYRLKCSDALKRNCELLGDCDEFERRETKNKIQNKKHQKK